ncbi:hypothetical protein C7N43_01625 [Sphingobacteriales bacterium UPWRP_1]|nr:hypothetical protein BVG80_10595 [Sphingobacteriales bacterium TSM_CSM]PSJ78864.1 hypothetical protein C7N43_01625 [Sphingobacteriales bacterium UPWRP_1]
MSEQFNIPTLLSLLDDDDIWQQVANDLVKHGHEVVDELRRYCWANRTSLNDIQTERLEYILKRINFRYVYKKFSEWAKNSEQSLPEALKLLATYVYPTFDDSNNIIENKINRIFEDINIRILLNMSVPNKIEQVNNVIFNVYHFTVAQHEEMHNYALSYLLSYQKGSQALLTLLYLIITQKLGLPVYPVLLENHLILGALNHSTGSLERNIAGSGYEKRVPYSGQLDFFIDPSNKGVKFGKVVIQDFLRNNNLPADDKYFSPCSALQAVYFLLLTFSMTLHAKKDVYGTEEINKLLLVLEKYQ